MIPARVGGFPTTSVDQYSATLARWFGVDSTHMPTVFPNLGRFASPYLGFWDECAGSIHGWVGFFPHDFFDDETAPYRHV